MRRDRLPLVLAYGTLGLPLAALGLPMYVFLPGFYAEKMGMAAVGGALLAARLWDMVTDPVVGALGDRVTAGFGRRRTLILAGLPVLMLSADRLLRPPPEPGVGYLLGWGFAAYLGWTLVNLPYTAWGAELSRDYDRRSALTLSREGFAIAGILLAVTWPSLAGSGQPDAAALASLSVVLLVTLPVASLLVLGLVPDPPWRGEPTGWRRGWQLLRANRPFQRLLLAYLLNGIANGLPASLFTLFVAHVLQAPEWTGPLLIAYFASGVAALPLWWWLARRLGKHRSWSLSMLWVSAVFVTVPLLGAGDTTAFLLICLLSGVGVAVDMALPAAIQADLVDLDTSRGGSQRTGLYFGLWNVATKLALALAVGIAFPLLQWLGFDPRSPDDDGRLLLALAYGGLPVAFKLAAIALVWNFPYDRSAQRQVAARLQAGQAA